ncbi:unnamed protein product [Phytophthora lilii]|uniref:Unnamed protein product n=1 Tax=Phytophthora lilii TaxID=2077276 RepID=A0A9W6X458_9STRA|nr:unnamed protein product [Phytophthora lilii]
MPHWAIVVATRSTVTQALMVGCDCCGVWIELKNAGLDAQEQITRLVTSSFCKGSQSKLDDTKAPSSTVPLARRAANEDEQPPTD